MTQMRSLFLLSLDQYDGRHREAVKDRTSDGDQKVVTADPVANLELSMSQEIDLRSLPPNMILRDGQYTRLLYDEDDGGIADMDGNPVEKFPDHFYGW